MGIGSVIQRSAALTAGIAGVSAACGQTAEAAWRTQTGYTGPYVVIQEDTAPRPPFAFAPADEALLDEVQRATFRWFWDSPDVGPLGTIRDRSSGTLVSTAGIGYQFAAIVIGVERGWISREQGERRCVQVIEALLRSTRNRKEGLFFHFLEQDTLDTRPFADVVSTIDSAILFAGILTAASYFGGEVQQLADGVFAAANWPFFTIPANDPDPWQRGFVSLGWEPNDWINAPTGPGTLLNAVWIGAADEERLVYFLAAAAPDAARRLDPDRYYRLWRNMGQWGDLGPMTQLGGPLFTSFFAHLWIDYAAIGREQGPDRPDARGYGFRTPTDWWENSRRQVKLHRGKALLENPGFDTVTAQSWGMSASDGPTGYNVPGLFPPPLPLAGAAPFVDVRPWAVADNWLNGTVAPYTAGSAIMFEPALAIEALRYFRGLDGTGGTPALWTGVHGFKDAYNLDSGPTPWVAPDRVSIDQGPLLIAIENARSGLIWRVFHRHRYVRDAMERLGLSRGE